MSDTPTEPNDDPLAHLRVTDPRGRPMSRETRLGRYLYSNRIKSSAVAKEAGFSTRIMTEYIAGRRQITQKHLLAICRVLQTTPDQILDDIEDDYEDEVTTLTSSESAVAGIHNATKVKDLARKHKERLRGG